VNPRDSTRWQAKRSLHVHAWADGAVLYDADSGDTHLLNQPAFEILQSLQRSPRTLLDLIAALAATSAEERATIEAIVLNLNALGLIEPSPL
jgi:PqqD family protein of HPr-rel-A system